MRKSLSHVMSATPTKVCKKGRKPKIDIGGRASFENLFSPSRREESVGLILAECCGSIGFPLTREAGQDADLLASYCSIDDISGKSSVQLKVLIL